MCWLDSRKDGSLFRPCGKMVWKWLRLWNCFVIYGFDSRMVMLAWGLNQFVRFRPYWFLWFFDSRNGYAGSYCFGILLLATIFLSLEGLEIDSDMCDFLLLCYNSLLFLFSLEAGDLKYFHPLPGILHHTVTSNLFLFLFYVFTFYWLYYCSLSCISSCLNQTCKTNSLSLFSLLNANLT